MKKILTFAIGILTSIIATASFAAGNDITLTNNEGQMTVSVSSILVWDAKTTTSINDLFDTLTINWVTVAKEQYPSVLDVRYMSWNIDKKIFDETDKIGQWNKIFVLFKSSAEGWMVWADTVLSFKTKNITLNEYWTVSNGGANQYDIVWKFSYTTQSATPVTTPVVKPEVKPVTPVQSVDMTVIKENNTGIKDNILLILFALWTSFVLFISPLNIKLWATTLNNK